MFRKAQFIIATSSLMLLFIIPLINSAQTGTLRKSQQKILPVLLTLTDAEKILGEKAHITDSSFTANGTETYKLSFTADSIDGKTGKLGVIYYLFEKYETVSSAQKHYTSVKTSNKDHEGFKVLYGIGDEAYFHSDYENFYFIIVRKGEKIFNMKVNKITSKTSLDEFNAVAKNLAAIL